MHMGACLEPQPPYNPMVGGYCRDDPLGCRYFNEGLEKAAFENKLTRQVLDLCVGIYHEPAFDEEGREAYWTHLQSSMALS